VLEAEDILNGLLRGAIGGRGKPWRNTRRAFDAGSLIDARTIVAAAGVAWGLFETWQQQQQVQGTPSSGSSTTGGSAIGSRPSAGPAQSGPMPGLTTPPPLPSSATAVPEDPGLPPSILQLLRLMISAARADGEIGPAERERILAEAREVGAFQVVERELAVRRPLAEVVTGADDPELKEQLYALAYTIVRADAAVTGGERIYLAQLANRLGLDATSVARLEAEVSRRIDTAAAHA
jgi:uncharacterized membrane protein YebE (DUF533 family)